MADVVICEPLRTPVGGFGGSLAEVPPHTLAATTIRALLERTGLPADSIDDVLLGHCYPTMDAPAIGRVAALDAGLPVTVPGAPTGVSALPQAARSRPSAATASGSVRLISVTLSLLSSARSTPARTRSPPTADTAPARACSGCPRCTRRSGRCCGC